MPEKFEGQSTGGNLSKRTVEDIEKEIADAEIKEVGGILTEKEVQKMNAKDIFVYAAMGAVEAEIIDKARISETEKMLLKGILDKALENRKLWAKLEKLGGE